MSQCFLVKSLFSLVIFIKYHNIFPVYRPFVVVISFIVNPNIIRSFYLYVIVIYCYFHWSLVLYAHTHIYIYIHMNYDYVCILIYYITIFVCKYAICYFMDLYGIGLNCAFINKTLFNGCPNGFIFIRALNPNRRCGNLLMLKGNCRHPIVRC